MTTDNERQLREAGEAIRAGRTREARHLLEQVARQDPAEYRAWLWLAGVASSPQASLAYLEKAEALRPGDRNVARARRWAESRRAESPARPAARRHRRGRRLAVAGVLALFLMTMVAIASWLYLPGARVVLAQAAPGFQAVLPAPAAPIETVSQTPGDATPAAIAAAGANASRDVAGEALVVPATQAPTPEPTATARPTELPRPTATAVPARTEPAPPRIPAKRVGARVEARPTWTPTPPPTVTPMPTPTPSETPPPTATPEPPSAATSVGAIAIAADEPWIDVNLSTQTLTAYRGNKVVHTTLVSSGLWQWPTVTGQFRIYLRYEAQDMSGYHLGYNYFLPAVPHVMYFYKDYALHGAYWHSNFGTPMSHGCVNLSLDDAAWLFDFADVGTLVNVHY